METQTETLKNHFTENEVTLPEIVNIIWLGKYKLLIILVISSLLSVTFALSQPDIYKSEALLAPAENEQGGGLHL
ncbi:MULTISPECIES: Wzz/FepE/Etk N-terminal domain-containing protein [unclassified Pseudoalteromonas]|uniref:Wzz/FepE/Etk N-terminal domain-containing protein n=1 Tax=unclassified Pseudoalteromonas TaxID=194690 RepID=UPI00301D8851